MVFRVGHDFRMRLGDAAELGFPVAVEHHPVDVVLGRRTAGVPAVRPGRVKSDVGRGAGGIVFCMR